MVIQAIGRALAEGVADVDGSFCVLKMGCSAATVFLALLFYLQPPPTGTVLKVPPLVQYLLQVLQKR